MQISASEFAKQKRRGARPPTSGWVGEAEDAGALQRPPPVREAGDSETEEAPSLKVESPSDDPLENPNGDVVTAVGGVHNYRTGV